MSSSYFKSLWQSIGCLLLAGMMVACGEQQSTTSDNVAQAPAKTYQWKLVMSWPKNFPGLGVAPERLATMVDQMSAGRLKIKVYGAGELVPALEVFDAVSQGTAEMGHSGAYYWKGKIPAAQFFASVPFGLTAQEMNGWLHYGGGLALWDEIYAPFNIKPFAGGNSGVQMAGWFNKEINTLDDLRGLKMRIPGLGGEVFELAGGTAVNLPGAELYNALERGTIDATEWVGPYNDLAFSLHKVGKYYYYPGWHEPGTVLEFLVNKTALEKLPQDLQMILETATRAINQDLLDEYTARNAVALQDLIDKHNVQPRSLPKDVLDKLKQLSNQSLESLAASDATAKKVYESFDAYKKHVMNYQKISEQAFINARSE